MSANLMIALGELANLKQIKKDKIIEVIKESLFAVIS